MKPEWWHMLLFILIGVAIGYYFPAFGNMTFGKLYARKSS